MPSRISALAAAVLTAALPAVAHATFVYSFATDRVVPEGFPPLTGSFSVADAAIADGILGTAEVDSYFFTLGIVIFGDQPEDRIIIGGGFVDPISGIPLIVNTVSDVSLLDAALLAPPSIDGAVLLVDFGLPAGENFYHDQRDDPGFGTWTCIHDGLACATPVPVPAPSTLSLLGAALFSLPWLGRRHRRRAPTGCAAP
jgi:hypothetical protein